MVKSHANTVELALTVRIPNTQVRPSSGRRTSDPININLCRVDKKKINKQLNPSEFIILIAMNVNIGMCVDVYYILTICMIGGSEQKSMA